MENIKIKPYVIPQNLKNVWPENKLVYTVQIYTEGRTWDDGVISQSLYVNLNYQEYINLMEAKFDSSVKYDSKLFFSTKQLCEEAIEFMDSLITLSKLIKN